MNKFQSTPSQRGRHTMPYLRRSQSKISIHALAKRATEIAGKKLPKQIISIHALAKRATQLVDNMLKMEYISIHALAKRATDQRTAKRKSATISIHALAKRATVNAVSQTVTVIIFQSTPSQRGRQQIYTMIIYILKLNITFRTFFLYKIIKN